MSMLDALDRTYLVYLVVLLAVILMFSGNIWREQGLRRTVTLALIWVLIFLAMFTAFAYRNELGAIGRRLAGEADPARAVMDGDHVVIRRSGDGHFRVRAEVNGASVPFVIDSGASGIALTGNGAKAAGIDAAALNFDGVAMTASGMARTARVRLDHFSVGPISLEGVGAVVLPIDEGDSLLGMSFLNQLAAWQVEGDEMRLIPRADQ